MTEPRQRLTKFEYATIFLAQKGRCGCGCGERLEEGKVDEEHSIPNYYKPGKPDSLWRRCCHRRKTKKDIGDISKTKRLREESGQVARRKRNGSHLQSLNTLGGEEGKRRREWAKKIKEGNAE